MFNYQWVGGPCGVYAIQAALRMLGEDRTILSILSTRRTMIGAAQMFLGADHFDEKDICIALRNMGYSAKERKCANKEKFFSRLRDAFDAGNPCIVCVQDSRHWATFLGYYHDNFMWYDPFDSELIGMWSTEDILAWFDSDEYYFIEVRNHGNSLVNKIPVKYFEDPVARRMLLDKEVVLTPTPVDGRRQQ